MEAPALPALQVGMDRPRSNALCELLVHCGQREAFHVLRTQEQLGYMVWGLCMPCCVPRSRYALSLQRQTCLKLLHSILSTPGPGCAVQSLWPAWSFWYANFDLLKHALQVYFLTWWTISVRR